MLTQEITYTDYNGNKRTETFYFNLTKAELMEMELTKDGSMTSFIDRIVKANSIPELVSEFKKLILKAYGEKTEDGRRLMKSDELSKAFTETEAYSQLFMDLSTDDEKAANFIKSILPSDIAKEVGNITPTTVPALNG